MKKFLNGTTMCILGVLVAVVYIMMGGGKISVDTPVNLSLQISYMPPVFSKQNAHPLMWAEAFASL